jgi:hypothetical protein
MHAVCQNVLCWVSGGALTLESGGEVLGSGAACASKSLY